MTANSTPPNIGKASHDPGDALLKTSEAAALLRLSKRTLERHRAAGSGPLFISLGRSIKYRCRDLAAWIDARSYRSTSEALARRG